MKHGENMPRRISGSDKSVRGVWDKIEDQRALADVSYAEGKKLLFCYNHFSVGFVDAGLLSAKVGSGSAL